MPQKHDSRMRALRAQLPDIPQSPGVYLFHDRIGQIIYVGKAINLRKRLANYFRPGHKHDRKTNALIAAIDKFDTRTARNEDEALILETKLIKQYRPRYNVSFRDDKRHYLVRIDTHNPFPRIALTRIEKKDGATYFGPFPHSAALKTLLAWLNKHLGLRTCTPLRPDANTYRHCHDDIIKNCTAPCIGSITPEAYREKIDTACRLLAGDEQDLADHITQQMHTAAERLDFERAARLRDTLAALDKTMTGARPYSARANIFAAVPSTKDPTADLADLGEKLNLPSPPQIMECFDISNISDTHCVASMVQFRAGRPHSAGYRRYRIRTTSGQDDYAAMREVIRRRYRHLSQTLADDLNTDETSQLSLTEHSERLARAAGGGKKNTARYPDLIIVDGGRGQLSSAIQSLHTLGLTTIPTIGLAKENEEIHRPEHDTPLIIPHSEGALRLLQRIRDEAHRFANNYNQLLLKKRLTESILDDCPGISPAKKNTLLKHFGSITRLRRAPAADIAAIPGFGKKSAETIIRFLAANKH